MGNPAQIVIFGASGDLTARKLIPALLGNVAAGSLDAARIQVIGVSCLAGIGFTMSLFIGALAFADEMLMNQVKVGVIGGSLVSALLGVLLLSIPPRGALPPVANGARPH